MPSYSSGLGFPLFSSFCLVAYATFSCKEIFNQFGEGFNIYMKEITTAI
jgi:hypothetical protein